MKKIFLFFFLLIFPSIVYSAPTATLSISPSASDGTIITAADENTRNNTVSTTFNNHDHNDIDQTGNTLSIGDAAAGDKTIQANNADSNKPFFRYDDTNDRWVDSRNGTTINSILTVTGATATSHIFPSSPEHNSSYYYVGNAIEALAGTSRFALGTFTRSEATAGTQEITGVGFQAAVILFFAGQDTGNEFSVGFSNQTVDTVIYDQINGGAGTTNWGAPSTTNSSILGSETAGNTFSGEISSLTSDGYVITWTRTGTPTGTLTIHYLAIR